MSDELRIDAQAEFVFDMPLWAVVVPEVTALDENGQRVLIDGNPDGFCFCGIAGERCLALFTDEDLADRYIRRSGADLVAFGFFDSSVLIVFLEMLDAIKHCNCVLLDVIGDGSCNNRHLPLRDAIASLRRLSS